MTEAARAAEARVAATAEEGKVAATVAAVRVEEGTPPRCGGSSAKSIAEVLANNSRA